MTHTGNEYWTIVLRGDDRATRAVNRYDCELVMTKRSLDVVLNERFTTPDAAEKRFGALNPAAQKYLRVTPSLPVFF